MWRRVLVSQKNFGYERQRERERERKKKRAQRQRGSEFRDLGNHPDSFRWVGRFPNSPAARLGSRSTRSETHGHMRLSLFPVSPNDIHPTNGVWIRSMI